MDDRADELVALLGDPHRRVAAYDALIAMGSAAAAAARRGLATGNDLGRAQCCRVLDHVLDEPGIAALVGALRDPSAQVRVEALHALSCDRCKTGSCRPFQADVLGPAAHLLRNDPDPHVRAMACELLAQFPAGQGALAEARQRDASPAVRKKASWYLPGGPRYTPDAG